METPGFHAICSIKPSFLAIAEITIIAANALDNHYHLSKDEGELKISKGFRYAEQSRG
ncbi:MAG: hypothetical protein ACRDCA_26555 [Serratia sp. (in: enterobacteria)]|uniref:hypothetical protein n=1 Tax=Serratia sp. (in: enterobacteria) TaxID=616 RepID=UPI003F3F7F91